MNTPIPELGTLPSRNPEPVLKLSRPASLTIHSRRIPTATVFKTFGKWLTTPFGLLATIYGLNVIAWGGMLFLLLCNANPVMCWTPDGRGGKYYGCKDYDSPRRRWIEYDSQILNALFCVTGLGMIPCRFRDLYYLLSFRLINQRKYGRERKMRGLRRLAGHHCGWFRLPGSQGLSRITAAEYDRSLAGGPLLQLDGHAEEVHQDLRLPLPADKKSADPVTGVRAPDTALWKMDLFIWAQVWSTFFQVCLCGLM